MKKRLFTGLVERRAEVGRNSSAHRTRNGAGLNDGSVSNENDLDGACDLGI